MTAGRLGTTWEIKFSSLGFIDFFGGGERRLRIKKKIIINHHVTAETNSSDISSWNISKKAASGARLSSTPLSCFHGDPDCEPSDGF